MDKLKLADITFKYRDDEDVIMETNLFDIMIQIGYEYSIPPNVFNLTRCREMLEVKINNNIVWKTP